MNIELVTITWSHQDRYDIEKTSLYQSFKKFNSHSFKHFHFNRGHYYALEAEFAYRFGRESEYILYKIHMLHEELKKLTSEYIIFCDANDVVCTGSVDHLFNHYNLDQYIVFGMEKNQWPTPETKQLWSNYKDYKEFDSKNNYYLNSGVFIGKRVKIIEMLQNIITNVLSTNNKNFFNDQGVYTWYYNMEVVPEIKLDYSTLLVVNTYKKTKDEYYLYNNKLYSKQLGIASCFVHDNGWNHGSPKFINAFELRRIYSSTYPHLKNISVQRPINQTHQDYLKRLRDEFGFTPKVVYDVGACVLHWTTIAKEVWPNSDYYLFEAMEESEELFVETPHRYQIGVFSDVDNKEITFYKNVTFPGGNSYYKENPAHSSMADALFSNPSNQFIRKTMTLDTARSKNNFPYPDLLKIDVQGCEIDILKGAPDILKHVQHLIVELQHVEYNIGAQLCNSSIPIIESLGFELVTPRFSPSSPADADYHFKRKI